jgi:hypothetical protein
MLLVSSGCSTYSRPEMALDEDKVDTEIEVVDMDKVKRMRSRWFGSKKKNNPFTSDYVPSWEITIGRRGEPSASTVRIHRAT